MGKKFRVFTTREFDNDFNNLESSIQERINKGIGQLEINPYVGKPLGYKFFREKKVENYRFYYLVYEEYVVVFIIAMSTKKDQQATINTIKSLIPYHKEEIRKKLKLS